MDFVQSCLRPLLGIFPILPAFHVIIIEATNPIVTWRGRGGGGGSSDTELAGTLDSQPGGPEFESRSDH